MSAVAVVVHFFFGSVLGRVSYETMCRFLLKIGMIESGGTFTLFFGFVFARYEV
jgi:hypothetical protein